MKIVQILFTIIIIIMGILDYNSGTSPDWIMYFLGWGGVLCMEIKDLFRDLI
jgi:hypothetical protein